MPIGYPGYGTYGGNYRIGGYDSLFGNLRNGSFDIGIDDDELQKNLEEIRKNRKKKIQDIEGKTRKERIIQALPFIAAALVGDDQDTVRALMSYAELKSSERSRLQEYKKRQEEVERAAELRREDREDTQQFQVQQQDKEYGFRTNERLGSQKFKKSERKATQLFQLEKEDRVFRQDLLKMGYNSELTAELEEIRHSNRIEQERFGFIQDSELFRRQTSEDLAQRMEAHGIQPDIARSASEKVTLGVSRAELEPIEREALDTYRDLSKAESQQDRDLALLESARRVSSTGIPVRDDNGNIVVDPYTNKPITRPLHPSEILPFMVEGAEEGMRRLVSPENPAPREIEEKFGDEITYSNAASFMQSGDKTAEIILEESQRLDSDSRATEFAIELYQTYQDPRVVRSIIDNSNATPEYKRVMIQTIEEIEEQQSKRLELLEMMSNGQLSGQRWRR